MTELMASTISNELNLVEDLQSYVSECLAEPGTEFPLDLTEEGKGTAIYDPRNQRVKVFDFPISQVESPFTAEQLEPVGLGNMSEETTTSKLTVYSRPGSEHLWKRHGFRLEGKIESFFRNQDPALLWAAYSEQERGQEPDWEHLEEVLTIALSKKLTNPPKLAPEYISRRATEADAPRLSELMRATFKDYPTPLGPDHLKDLMDRHSNQFWLIEREGQVLASASAELDHERRTAEMTDCATHSEARGQGLMSQVLHSLEKDIADVYGITDLFSLARANEVGVNCVFSKLGYEYSGRLVNNCRMPSGWESMNIWCSNKEKTSS